METNELMPTNNLNNNINNNSEEVYKRGTTFHSMLTQEPNLIKDTKVKNCEEELEAVYNQEITKLVLSINRSKRDQTDIITDMYPESSISNKICIDFNAYEFMDKDFNLMLNIRENVIKLSILYNRFNELFDNPCKDLEAVEKILSQYNF